MNYSTVLIIILIEVILSLGSLAGHLFFKDKIRMAIARRKVNDFISEQEEQEKVQLAIIKEFLENQLHWKPEESEKKSTELLQAQRTLLKSIVHIYVDKEAGELQTIFSDMQAAVGQFAALTAAKEEGKEIVIDTSSNEVTLQLLALLAKAKGKTLDSAKQYTSTDIQEWIAALKEEVPTASSPLPQPAEAPTAVASEQAATEAPSVSVPPVENTVAAPLSETATTAPAPSVAEVGPTPAAEGAVTPTAKVQAAPGEKEGSTAVSPPPAAAPFELGQFAVGELDLESDLSLEDVTGTTVGNQAKDKEKASTEEQSSS